jgi:hypothetical protein
VYLVRSGDEVRKDSRFFHISRFLGVKENVDQGILQVREFHNRGYHGRCWEPRVHMNQLCRLDFEFWQRVRSEEEQAETLVERVACVHASVDVFFHIISGLCIR